MSRTGITTREETAQNPAKTGTKTVKLLKVAECAGRTSDVGNKGRMEVGTHTRTSDDGPKLLEALLPEQHPIFTFDDETDPGS